MYREQPVSPSVCTHLCWEDGCCRVCHCHISERYTEGHIHHSYQGVCLVSKVVPHPLSLCPSFPRRPSQALSNQKYRQMCELFSDVGLMTGDLTINPSASCIIMTTEVSLYHSLSLSLPFPLSCSLSLSLSPSPSL